MWFQEKKKLTPLGNPRTPEDLQFWVPAQTAQFGDGFHQGRIPEFQLNGQIIPRLWFQYTHLNK